MNKELGIKDKKIQRFTDLRAWRESHRLVVQVYILTRRFPKEELFGLVSQMRRAAVSITSNIAEGFSRQTYKEKVHFYAIALGSLTELQNQFLVARDVGIIAEEDFKECATLAVAAHKMILGLIRSSKTKILNS